MNPAQEAALAQLAANRLRFLEHYPNQWIAVDANGEVRRAERFDLLVGEYDLDSDRVIFAFIAVGAWA